MESHFSTGPTQSKWSNIITVLTYTSSFQVLRAQQNPSSKSKILVPFFLLSDRSIQMNCTPLNPIWIV